MSKFSLTILFLTFNLVVYSQQVKITGTLINLEDRKPLTNYLLIITGTDSGTTTNSNGYFELTLDTLRSIELRNPAPHGTDQFIKIPINKSGKIELGELSIWSHGLGRHYFSKKKEKLLFNTNKESTVFDLTKENDVYIFELR